MSNQSVVNAIRVANLSDKQIIANMSDPPDAKRRKNMDKLAQQAAAGDQAALLRLKALSGYDVKKEKTLGGVDPYADLRGDFKAQFGTANPGAATADEAMFRVWATFRSVGSGTSAVLQAVGQCTHRLSVTGFTGINAVSDVRAATSSGFNSATASTIIGLSVNGGTSASWTTQLVQARLENFA